MGAGGTSGAPAKVASADAAVGMPGTWLEPWVRGPECPCPLHFSQAAIAVFSLSPAPHPSSPTGLKSKFLLGVFSQGVGPSLGGEEEEEEDACRAPFPWPPPLEIPPPMAGVHPDGLACAHALWGSILTPVVGSWWDARTQAARW